MAGIISNDDKRFSAINPAISSHNKVMVLTKDWEPLENESAASRPVLIPL